MVASGVVWCLKDEQWIPLQLSSIRLHGVLTQAHWAAISDFLQRFSNKQLILQDNGFTELTDQQSELLLKQRSKVDNKCSEDVQCTLQLSKEEERSLKTDEGKLKQWQNLVVQENGLMRALNGKNDRNGSRKSGLFQIPEQETSCLCDDGSRKNSLDNSNLFISNLFKETDETPEKLDKEAPNKKTERKLSEQSDEIVLRLLRKYCKYSRGALDDRILNEIEGAPNKEDDSPPPTPSRRLSYCPAREKLYENCGDFVIPDDHFENERNEHVLRWLKQQNRQKGLSDFQENRETRRDFPPSRKYSVFSIGDGVRKNKVDDKSTTSSSGIDSRKSSLASVTTAENKKSGDSRKSSLSSPCTSDSRKSSFSNVGSRKSSVASNSSCSESEDGGNLHWHKILKKHLSSKKLEKRFKKQREAWARNTRKLSSGSESYSVLASQ